MKAILAARATCKCLQRVVKFMKIQHFAMYSYKFLVTAAAAQRMKHTTQSETRASTIYLYVPLASIQVKISQCPPSFPLFPFPFPSLQPLPFLLSLQKLGVPDTMDTRDWRLWYVDYTRTLRWLQLKLKTNDRLLQPPVWSPFLKLEAAEKQGGTQGALYAFPHLLLSVCIVAPPERKGLYERLSVNCTSRNTSIRQESWANTHETRDSISLISYAGCLGLSPVISATSREKITKNHILGVRGRSRSSMLVPPVRY